MSSERLEEILPSIRGLIDYILKNKGSFSIDFCLRNAWSKDSVWLDFYGVRICDDDDDKDWAYLTYEDIIKWMKEREGE